MQNDLDSADFENTEKVSYSQNENKLNLEVRSEKTNRRKLDPKKMSSNILLSNTPKKIKNVHKPLHEFEEESEINYCGDQETKYREDKRKEIL